MQRAGTIMCLASGAAFGAMAIFGKLAYGAGATLGTLLSLRFLLAGALFWLLVAATGGVAHLRALSRHQVATGIALGAVGYATQAGCYFAALQRIDASLLSLLLYTFPTMVAIAAVAIGRERLEARKIGALVLASCGLVLVLAGAAPGAVDPLGAALAVGAAVVYSVYILLSDRVVGAMRPELLSALVCTGAAIPLTAGAALLGQLHVGQLELAGWGWIICLAAVSTVGAVGLFFAGLRRVGPTTASILATVESVVTVVLAFL